MLMHFNSANYWQLNLVCPFCREELAINDQVIKCKCCGRFFSIEDDVPNFVGSELSEDQKAEAEYDRIIESKRISFESPFYGWAKKWINKDTVNSSTKIICVGGALLDDLPHVNSDYKFNIDYIAHKNAKIFSQMLERNIKHIAATAEALPFKDGWADIVYTRNALDHFQNPLRALLEIYRVLKPGGKFFLSVYYDSHFVDDHESTVIDDELVNKYIKNLFDIEWHNIVPSESEKVAQPPHFFLPNNRTLKWLYLVGEKRNVVKFCDEKSLDVHEGLLGDFQKAVYYDRRGQHKTASKFFLKVLNQKPVLNSDKMRILYSKIRYLALKDRKAFKEFFNKFKPENNDPFWWKTLIESSYTFMKRELKQEISKRFSGEERRYLEQYMRDMWLFHLRNFIKHNRVLLKIVLPFHLFFKRSY